MEPDSNNLAHAYVQDFVLEHLEETSNNSIKREGGMGCRGGGLPPFQRAPQHLLTPPGSEEHHHHSIYPMDQVGMEPRSLLTLVPQPGTPPITPPVSTSPATPGYQAPGMVEDLNWCPQPGLRTEPLDLRPHCTSDMPNGPEWVHTSVITNGGCQKYHDYLDDDLPLSRGSSVLRSHPGGPSPGGVSYNGDDILNDDALMSLTVRELNKRLHGFPREEVVRLKQKRRTLKNRGYAQNCRSKRLQQRHELELRNRQLMSELDKLQMEFNQVVLERNYLREKLQQCPQTFT